MNSKTNVKKAKIKETDLYLPVKKHFEALGYIVHGEVKDCDMACIKEDELVVIELKLVFSAKLLFQGIDRQKFADKTYIAIPNIKLSYKDLSKITHIVKKLDLGLIVVNMKKSEITVHNHPKEYLKVKNTIKKRIILREIKERLSNLNTGGQVNEKIITAYREKCVYAAVIIMNEGEVKPKKLRSHYGFDKNLSQTILAVNHYNWFSRKSQGVYILNKNAQKEILEDFRPLYKLYSNLYLEKVKENEKDKI